MEVYAYSNVCNGNDQRASRDSRFVDGVAVLDRHFGDVVYDEVRDGGNGMRMV
jgi:hypothetical protein